MSLHSNTLTPDPTCVPPHLSKIKDLQLALQTEERIFKLQRELEVALEFLWKHAQLVTLDEPSEKCQDWLDLLESQKEIAASACSILRSQHKQRLEWLVEQQQRLERVTPKQDDTQQERILIHPMQRTDTSHRMKSQPPLQKPARVSSPLATTQIPSTVTPSAVKRVEKQRRSQTTTDISVWLAHIHADMKANEHFSLVAWFQSCLQPAQSELPCVVTFTLKDVTYQNLRVPWRDGIDIILDRLLDRLNTMRSPPVLFVTSAPDNEDSCNLVEEERGDGYQSSSRSSHRGMASFANYWYQLSCTSEWTRVEERGTLVGPWTRLKVARIFEALCRMIQLQYEPLRIWAQDIIRPRFENCASFSIWYQPSNEFGVFDDDDDEIDERDPANSNQGSSRTHPVQERKKRYMFGPSFDRLFNGTCMVVVCHQQFRTVGGQVFRTGQELATWIMEQYPELGDQEPRSLYVSRDWNVHTHAENDPRVFWEDYIEELDADWPQIQKCCQQGPIRRHALVYLLDQLLSIPKMKSSNNQKLFRRHRLPDTVRKRIDQLKIEKSFSSTSASGSSSTFDERNSFGIAVSGSTSTDDERGRCSALKATMKVGRAHVGGDTIGKNASAEEERGITKSLSSKSKDSTASDTDMELVWLNQMQLM